METTMQFEVKTKKPIDIDDDLFPILNKNQWYVSEMTWGLRCIMTYIDGKLTAYYKNGDEITTIGTLKQAMLEHLKTGHNVVFDGVITVPNGSNVHWLVPRALYSIDIVVYEIFDCIPNDEYVCGKGRMRLGKRMQLLQTVLPVKRHPRFIHIPKTAVISADDFKEHGIYQYAPRSAKALQTDVPFGDDNEMLLWLHGWNTESFPLKDYTLAEVLLPNGTTVKYVDSIELEFYANPNFKFIITKGASMKQRVEMASTIHTMIGAPVKVASKGMDLSDEYDGYYMLESAFIGFGDAHL